MTSGLIHSSFDQWKPSRKPIPSIKQCIAYVESCNFIYEGRNGRWYLFRRNGQQISFTLHEIRDALMNGF
jgi:hypothetical protein